MLFNSILNCPWEHPVKQILNTEAELRHPLPSPQWKKNYQWKKNSGRRHLSPWQDTTHLRPPHNFSLWHQRSLLSEDSVFKPQFLPHHLQLPNTARKARNLKSSLGNGLLWVDILSFPIPPNRQLDTFTASQQNSSLHNKEEAANRNKKLLEIQEKNLNW